MFPSLLQGIVCVTMRLGREEKTAFKGMIRGDGGRRTMPFALPIVPLCLLFLFIYLFFIMYNFVYELLARASAEKIVCGAYKKFRPM